MIPIDATLSQSVHWAAELALAFERRDETTCLSARRHSGPLRVQKALYPEGKGVCQVLLLHPPSGIAGGDHLKISAQLGAGAQVQLTTPGAGKWYRSGGPDAAQHLSFDLAAGAALEWLPQESIFFDGALANMETQVSLAADARFIAWEILCLGRSAAGEKFAQGQIFLQTRITREGKTIWLERGNVGGADDVMRGSAAAWSGASVCATMMVAAPQNLAELLPVCRELHPVDGAMHGLTALPEVLLARYLGHSSEAARLWLTAVWQALREPVLGRPAVIPRIWNT